MFPVTPLFRYSVTRMRISLIVAATENNVIGAKGGLPWSLPNDFKRMKELTVGHPIIMGRKTHESIGRVLPERRNIVITRKEGAEFPGCDVVASLQQALGVAKSLPPLSAGGRSGCRSFHP